MCLLIIISDKHQVKCSPGPAGGEGEEGEAVCDFLISANKINPCAACVLSVDF